MERKDSDLKASSIPYVPFSTLCTALDHLKSHGIPDRINSSVFPTFSGAVVSHLLLAMRFLELIDEKGVPQPELVQLVDDKTRKQTLARIIPQTYSKLFQRVDLAKASPTTLDEAINAQNVHGATVRKAKGFLIKAAQFAGLPISNHLLKRSRSSSASRSNNTTRKPQSDPAAPKPQGNGSDQQIARYSKIIKLPDAGGTLALSGDFDPFSLHGGEREFVYKIADLMSEFATKGKVSSDK
jgi:hypothetical protein